MKKLRGLLFAFICFICLFLVSGCSSKTAIGSEDFKVMMDSKDFKITDATSQFVKDEYVKKVYVASSSDSAYQIEFYEFDTDQNGLDFYNTNVNIFEKNKDNSSLKTTVSIGKYNKYVLSGNNKYQVVSRIGNTAVYVDADAKYKDNIKSIIEELGY